MNKVLLFIPILLIILGGIWFFGSKKPETPSSPIVSQGEENSPRGEASPLQYAFSNPKKSAHYESNTPAHAAVLARVPINVVIDVNFDLAKPSAITIKRDTKDYGVGETAIDKNKLAMRREMDMSAPEGLYTVAYKACWPDGSCHDGSFQFAIDKSLKKGFQDLTGRTEAPVALSNIMFEPQNIRVSKGTKVVWTNDDNLEHFVNTDSHPAHTYYPQQNSESLKRGDSFSLVFDKAGIYPYHCSAHADSMTATILVE